MQFVFATSELTMQKANQFYTFKNGKIRGIEFSELKKLEKSVSEPKLSKSKGKLYQIEKPSTRSPQLNEEIKRSNTKLWHYDKNNYPKIRSNSLPNLREKPSFKLYSISKPDQFKKRPLNTEIKKRITKLYAIDRPNIDTSKPSLEPLALEPKKKEIKVYALARPQSKNNNLLEQSPIPVAKKSKIESKVDLNKKNN